MLKELCICNNDNSGRQSIQLHKNLDNAATFLSGCKNLLLFSIFDVGYHGFTEQHIHNFANALKPLTSLRAVLFHKGCIECHDTKLLNPVLEALGNLPQLYALRLDDWILPCAGEPTEIHTKFSQLLNRITRFQIHYMNLPEAFNAIRSSKSIRSLTVTGINGGQGTHRFLGDLVYPQDKEKLNKAIGLEELYLCARFSSEENEGQLLDCIEKVEKSTNIKKLCLEFNQQPSPKTQQALQSMLAVNLSLSSVLFKPVRNGRTAPLPENFINPLLIDLCMNRNWRCKALLEDPQATNQQTVDFLVDYKNQVNTTFWLLSKKPSVVESCVEGARDDQFQPVAAKKKRITELEAEAASLKAQLLLAKKTGV